MTLFDHIQNILIHKQYDIIDTDLKSFDVYMINRWMSMIYTSNVDMTQIISQIQLLTCHNNIPKRLLYNLYLKYIPKFDGYINYITSKKTKYRPELIHCVTDYFDMTITEANNYIRLVKLIDKNNEHFKSLLFKMGIRNKRTINSILK